MGSKESTNGSDIPQRPILNEMPIDAGCVDMFKVEITNHCRMVESQLRAINDNLMESLELQRELLRWLKIK